MIDERPGREIAVEVRTDGNKVKCRVDSDTKKLLDEIDRRYIHRRNALEKYAKANHGKNFKLLENGEFVHFHDVTEDRKAANDHATIHLYRREDQGDQITWYTDEPDVKFYVSIQRNPELVGVFPDVRPGIIANDGIDNPFETTFPENGLAGEKGKPVFSGLLRDDDNVFLQQYYKYRVRAERNGEKLTPYDPDIEGHYGG